MNVVEGVWACHDDDVHPVVLGDRLQLAHVRIDHGLDRQLPG
jgi:hypothetical protein